MQTDVLLPCAHCAGQPVILIAPHGGAGLTGVRIECSRCGISTPEVVFGGRRSLPEGRRRAGEVVDPRWCFALQDARARCAERWNQRGGVYLDQFDSE